MKNPYRVFMVAALALAVWSLAANRVNAAEVSFPQCPQKLTIRQENKAIVGDGWKVVDGEASTALEHISISFEEYPVKQTGFDIPDGRRKGARGDVTVYYEVIPTSGGVHDYWAICSYYNTSVVLVQQIPENARRCEVTIRNDVLAPDRVTIKCFDTPLEGSQK